MKKLLIVVVSLGLALGASAQIGFHGGGFHQRPRVIVGIGAGFGHYRRYSPFYSPMGYSPYGYPRYSQPSRLQLDIEGIRIDYKDRIRSVRMDKSITGRERRQRIRELKYERGKAIVGVKRDYYYNRSGR